MAGKRWKLSSRREAWIGAKRFNQVPSEDHPLAINTRSRGVRVHALLVLCCRV
jgi:hypothetical protein